MTPDFDEGKDKTWALYEPPDETTEADYYKNDPVVGAGSMRYWTKFWLRARGKK